MVHRARVHTTILAGLGVLLAFSFSYVCTAASLRNETQILDRVTIAGADVGGKTLEEAGRMISELVTSEMGSTGQLTFGERVFRPKLKDMGFSADPAPALREAARVGRGTDILETLGERVQVLRSGQDIAVPLQVEYGKLRTALRTIAERVDRPPTDAKVVFKGAEINVAPEQAGYRLEIEDSLRLVLASRPALGTALKCELAVTEIPPQVFARDLQDLTVIGRFSTHFPIWQTSRVGNIKLACQIMDGTVVSSGGIFSLNQAVGNRTWERGFRYAPVYSGKKVVIGIGGGVCQVSTTTYNAALKAGMKIVERHQHSLPVHYVPWGMDATVSYPSPDMRFQNILDSPVVVKAQVEGPYITVSVLGRKGAKPVPELAEEPKGF